MNEQMSILGFARSPRQPAYLRDRGLPRRTCHYMLSTPCSRLFVSFSCGLGAGASAGGLLASTILARRRTTRVNNDEYPVVRQEKMQIGGGSEC
jgi:hypothetical protein